MALRVTKTLVALLACAAAAAPAASAAAADPASLRAAYTTLTDVTVSYAQRTDDADTRYFADGEWHSGDTRCWACSAGGPATAAAILWTQGGRRDPFLRQMAIDTVDTAIAQRQRADGSFAGPQGDTQVAGIANIFYGVELGTTYLELARSLDAARKARWQRALARSADAAIDADFLEYYVNGNLNLAAAELMYMAWRATGKRRFGKAYEQALAFTLKPAGKRWRGYGLRVTDQPKRADGSDGSGYLTEDGGNGPGYDPEYTILSLDVASRLWLLSGDRRVLRLVNLLHNQISTRMSNAWRVDVRGGSRSAGKKHDALTFNSPATATLAWAGGRRDLRAAVTPQLTAMLEEFRGAMNYSNVGYYRGLGNELAVVLLASRGAARSHVPVS